MTHQIETNSLPTVRNVNCNLSRGRIMRNVLSIAALSIAAFGVTPIALAQDNVQTQTETTGEAASAESTLQSAFEKLIADSKSQMMRDPAAALKYADSAESLVRGAPQFDDRDQAVATAMWLRGEALVRSGKPEDGASVIADALMIVGDEGMDTKLGGDLLMAQGRVAGRLSDTKTAAKSFFKAHDVFVALELKRNEAMSLQAIGSIYRDAESYDKALDYYERASEVYPGDKSLDLSSFNNQGNTLKELERFDDARAYYAKAVAIAVEMDSPVLQARILTNVADLEVLAGNYAAAETIAAKALGFLEGDTDTEWARFIYGAQAHAKLKTGNVGEAKSLIEKAFLDLDVADTSLSYEEMHDTAYQIYRSHGDTALALDHHESFKRLSDDAKKVASSANLALMAARFQTAEQTLNIERLKDEQLHKDILLESANQRQNMQVAIMAVGGLVVLFFFFNVVSMRRNRARITRINEQLTNTVDQLNEEIARREVVECELVVAKEEAEQASDLKSTFLATMSHELRTPMNGILGFSKLLLSGELAEEQRSQLEIIEQSGESLLVLINDILDLSQMEAGKLSLNNAPFNLSKTVEGAVKLLQAKAQEKSLSLAVHIDPALPTIVNGDSGRVRQILVNLVGNAIKFTETGTVAAFVTPGDNEHGVKISVIDTGVGIPADKVDGLYDRFSQVDSSTSRKFEGTGLGLAICKELVEAMQGNLGLDSVLGEGSEFWVEMPLAAVEDIAVLPNSGIRRIAEAATVLVVENDRIKRKLFAAMLPTINATPIIVESAAAGLDMLASLKADNKIVDAVIVAGELSDLTAGDFARLARDKGLLGNAKVVLCSAANVDHDVLMAMGFDSRIDQPITVRSLFSGLPLDDRQGQAQREPAETVKAPTDIVALKKRSCFARALVVDDNETNILLVSKILSSFGVEVETASNGQKAVKAVEENSFDLVFMDINMPVMDGIEATRAIRNFGGEYATLPIIALTALATPGDRERFLEAGMNDYLAKPIDTPALRAMVMSVMDRRETTRRQSDGRKLDAAGDR